MAELTYLNGFGNHHVTEAINGTLPEGRNSPQKVNHELYAEQISGTSFTSPRAVNRRSWVYRIRPSVVHGRHQEYPLSQIDTAPFEGIPCSPDRYRWSPIKRPEKPTSFPEGIHTIAATGDFRRQEGIAVHLYAINQSMGAEAFANFDGEFLIIPQEGNLKIKTEMGLIELEPLEIGVIPKGIRFHVSVDGPARGYLAENYGHALELPELGPIGSNGLANPRDFQAPIAWFEDRQDEFQLITKAQGCHWKTSVDRSPFDVVGWHGTLYPYKYDLRRFNTIGSISFDHPDPSIFTVLNSPSDSSGVANLDFVIFPPRWLVGENTFRPPWYHRNIMSEYMGLIRGAYDAKITRGGFVPGGGSLHNSYAAHGPDAAAFKRASEADLKPQKLDKTMAFMFETRFPFQLTSRAMQEGFLQSDYEKCWEGLEANFKS